MMALRVNDEESGKADYSVQAVNLLTRSYRWWGVL